MCDRKKPTGNALNLFSGIAEGKKVAAEIRNRNEDKAVALATAAAPKAKAKAKAWATPTADKALKGLKAENAKLRAQAKKVGAEQE